MPIQVSPEVKEQMEFIRQSGVTNMLDRRGVREAADFCGLEELVEWIDETPSKEYGRAFFEGMTVEGDDEQAG